MDCPQFPLTSITISSVLSIVGVNEISTEQQPCAGTTPLEGSIRKLGFDRISRIWNSKSIGTCGGSVVRGSWFH